jgi:hypothetical protein
MDDHVIHSTWVAISCAAKASAMVDKPKIGNQAATCTRKSFKGHLLRAYFNFGQ